MEVFPTSIAKAIVATLAADTTTFKGMVIELYQNPVTISPASVFSDFTPATFDGYAASTTFTFSGPANDPSGNGLEIAANVVFISTARRRPTPSTAPSAISRGPTR